MVLLWSSLFVLCMYLHVVLLQYVFYVMSFVGCFLRSDFFDFVVRFNIVVSCSLLFSFLMCVSIVCFLSSVCSCWLLSCGMCQVSCVGVFDVACLFSHCVVLLCLILLSVLIIVCC